MRDLLLARMCKTWTAHGRDRAGWDMAQRDGRARRRAGAGREGAGQDGSGTESCAQGMTSCFRPPEHRRQSSWTSLRKNEQNKSCVNRMEEHDGRFDNRFASQGRWRSSTHSSVRRIKMRGVCVLRSRKNEKNAPSKKTPHLRRTHHLRSSAPKNEEPFIFNLRS